MAYPITSQRLSISPLEMADLASFVEYRQDPAVARFQGWEPTYSDAQARDLIESQDSVLFPAKDQWLQLGVRLSTSNELLGDVAIHSLESDDCYEIGFTFAQSNQGKGYAREAVAALLSFLFTTHAAQQVVATPDARNLRSINLLSKLGFREVESKAWVEEFKGETVKVKHFELNRICCTA